MMGRLVARDAHAEPVSVHGDTGALVIAMGPAGSLDLDIASAISLRDAIDRGLRIADAVRRQLRAPLSDPIAARLDAAAAVVDALPRGESR